MRIARSLNELADITCPSVVTVGNFDGVHCGHRTVLTQVNARARQLGAQSAVVTFDPHPALVLGKESNLRLITPLPDKLELLKGSGVDLVLVLPFSEQMSRWTAREFAQRVLCEGLQAVEVHEGENFRFGRDAEAGIAGLAQLGQELSFTVRAAEPYVLRGSAISSSRVRALISRGEVHQARPLLGRPFSISSTPASGRGYGTKYAVPTINLAPYQDLLPANGVYISTLAIGSRQTSRTFQAVTNIGNRPTFGADSFSVESHLLGFEPIELRPDTYLRLAFFHRLREERRFDSPDALKQQIVIDVTKAKRYFALTSALRASVLS